MASMNLLRALATVSGMTLLSRILGFVRDFVVARAFGAGVETDAFFVAFRLPNLLRRMFAEGAFSQAFVPILAEYKNKRGEAETHRLVNHVASGLGLVVLLVSILGAIAAPLIIYATAPGFSADAGKFELTVQLTRITFPYIFFMSLVALAGGVLNTWSRFAIPAFTPVLLNLSFIAMALLAAPYFDPPVMALGWAVFIGGLAQVLLQLRPLANIGMLPRFSLDFSDPGVRRILKLMAPAILGVSVSQISLLINTVFASFLESGSVSWLYYADRLMEFPAGLLGVALGTILLPSLSRLHADDKADEFSSLLDWGLRLTLMLTLPAALGLALLAVPLDRHPLPPRRLHGQRRAPDPHGADRLQRRPGRADPRQGAGAGLLRSPGHSHAGEDRADLADGNPADEPRLHRPAAARWAGAVDRPRLVHQRRHALPRPAQARRVSAPAGLGAVLRQAAGGAGRAGRRRLVHRGQRQPVAAGLRP
jgi:peptidoglycan biosynthesis protein MviN/MurJ (putative lipid II flippase)